MSNTNEIEILAPRVNRELYAAENEQYGGAYDTYSSPDDDLQLRGAAASSSAARAADDVVRVDRRRRRGQAATSESRRRTIASNDARVRTMRSQGEFPDWRKNTTQPFTTDSSSPSYDDDPARKLKSTKDFYMMRILFADYPFKYLMVADIVSICMYASFAVVSGLVAATGADEINTYLYLIIGTVLNGIITLGAHLPMSVYYWMKRKQYGLTHHHLISTTLPLVVSIPVMIFGWFGLGRWISSFGSCCGLDENQPNPANAEELNQFVWAHASLAVASLISFMYFPFSIWAHLYPEVDVEIHDQVVHVRDVADERDDQQ